MKATKMFGKKRLSAMMAAAFSFGAAFSLTPSDALAATVEITQVGTKYVFTEDGTSRDVLAKDFAAEFNKVTGTANNEITVTGGARSVIAGNDVNLAPGTTLNVNRPGGSESCCAEEWHKTEHAQGDRWRRVWRECQSRQP